MAPAEQGSMAGDKRLSQKDPGLWLLMPRVLGWAWLFCGGWDGMSYVKLCAWFTLWKVPCCHHGLCAEFSVFLLFVTLWLPVVTCLRSQLSAYEVK